MWEGDEVSGSAHWAVSRVREDAFIRAEPAHAELSNQERAKIWEDPCQMEAPQAMSCSTKRPAMGRDICMKVDSGFSDQKAIGRQGVSACSRRIRHWSAPRRRRVPDAEQGSGSWLRE